MKILNIYSNTGEKRRLCQNYFFLFRSFAQESTVDGVEKTSVNQENLKDCDNKIKELISAKHELEKVICIFITNIILDT